MVKEAIFPYIAEMTSKIGESRKILIERIIVKHFSKYLH